MPKKLTNENIVQTVEYYETWALKYKFEKKKVLLHKMIVEETLLKYQDEFGTNIEFDAKLKKYPGTLEFVITVESEELNPFDDNEDDTLYFQLINRTAPIFKWSYTKNTNRIVFPLKKKVDFSELHGTVMALIFGILCGFILTRFAPEKGIYISENILSPISDRILGAISTFAVFSIFLSVVTGICDMGSASDFYSLGGRILKSGIIKIIIYTSLVAVVLSFIFNIGIGAGTSFDAIPIFNMILQIIPTNLVSPIIEGNVLQLIFIAICTGIAIVSIGEEAEIIKKILSPLYQVFQMIVSAISIFIPLLIFITIVKTLVYNHLNYLFQSYQYALCHVLSCCSIATISFILVYINKGISPSWFFKRMWKIWMMAFSASSSMAVFSENIKTCESKLELDPKIIKMSLPLEQIIFKPGNCIRFMAITFSLTRLYGVDLHLTGLITAIFLSIMLSIATPPIAGGSIMSYTLFVSHLGLPKESIALIIALDIILDRVGTTLNVMLVHHNIVLLWKEPKNKNEARTS